jgi:hypothetical protein
VWECVCGKSGESGVCVCAVLVHGGGGARPEPAPVPVGAAHHLPQGHAGAGRARRRLPRSVPSTLLSAYSLRFIYVILKEKL